MRRRSIWGKINHFEIEAKRRELIILIRGRHDENISRVAAKHATRRRKKVLFAASRSRERRQLGKDG
jgi:metallophosphoesterase superfamily enzyme